jgi:aspartate racemase
MPRPLSVRRGRATVVGNTSTRGTDMAAKPRHIGIVACSAEGAALCYRTICTEGAALLGAHAHPEVSMHTPSLADYMKHIYRDDWRGVGEVMLASAEKLARVGAEFLICPDNTIHQALPYIVQRSPLPWLHIAEVAAARAAERGVAYVRPNEAERAEINRIIMDELVYGSLKPDSVAYFQRVIARLKDEGCDAVVLGCTEIPLIISDANSPLPTLDSTRLLAQAALRRATEGTAAAA